MTKKRMSKGAADIRSFARSFLPAHHDVVSETWSATGGEFVPCEDCFGGIDLGVPDDGGHPPGSCFARNRLAAAAPEMARLLLALIDPDSSVTSSYIDGQDKALVRAVLRKAGVVDDGPG